MANNVYNNLKDLINEEYSNEKKARKVNNPNSLQDIKRKKDSKSKC